MASVEDQLKDIDNKDDMIKLLVNYYYTHVRKLYGESAAYEDTERIIRKLYGKSAAHEYTERITRKANESMDNKEDK